MGVAGGWVIFRLGLGGAGRHLVKVMMAAERTAVYFVVFMGCVDGRGNGTMRSVMVEL